MAPAGCAQFPSDRDPPAPYNCPVWPPHVQRIGENRERCCSPRPDRDRFRRNADGPGEVSGATEGRAEDRGEGRRQGREEGRLVRRHLVGSGLAVPRSRPDLGPRRRHRRRSKGPAPLVRGGGLGRGLENGERGHELLPGLRRRRLVLDRLPGHRPEEPVRDLGGHGENNSQRSVGYGDGVYRSEDGGKSWKKVGLEKSEHIGRILIDPKNTDTVYVAAQGPLWAAGGDRGLYKTTDGGKSWKAVLAVSENTG